MQKKTADLVPGDIVVFAEIRDTVLSTTITDYGIRVAVERRFTDGRVEQSEKTWFNAGIHSVQTVESRE